MQRTFVMVKPDGVQRGLTGEIIRRIQSKGFRLAGMKLMQISPELAQEHYQEHQGKPFFKDLVTFITSGPVVAMVWEGPQVITAMRTMMGKTNPGEAAPGTIRGDLATSINFNVIHGSDSPEAAQREIKLFFKEEEILDWQRDADKWIYG